MATNITNKHNETFAHNVLSTVGERMKKSKLCIYICMQGKTSWPSHSMHTNKYYRIPVPGTRGLYHGQQKYIYTLVYSIGTL